MTKLRLVFVFSCLILFAVATSPVFANGVKADLGASGRGVANPDCAGTILVNPACFEFSTTSATTATWEAFSLTDFNTATFSTIGPYDLFLVTGITSGTQVTLTLTGASDVFGSFLCGDDPTMTTQLGGFCADPTNDLLPESLCDGCVRTSNLHFQRIGPHNLGVLCNKGRRHDFRKRWRDNHRGGAWDLASPSGWRWFACHCKASPLVTHDSQSNQIRFEKKRRAIGAFFSFVN